MIPRRRAALLAAATLIVALLATLAVAMRGPSSLELPEFVDRPIAEVRATAEDLGLVLKIASEPGLPPADRVTAQTPEAGALLEPGSTVRVVVSDGSLRLVPVVTGLKLAEARSRIEARGLTVGSVRAAETNGIEPGTVIGQDPPASEVVADGTAVTLTVARAPAPPPSDDEKGDDEGKGRGKGKDDD